MDHRRASSSDTRRFRPLGISCNIFVRSRKATFFSSSAVLSSASLQFGPPITYAKLLSFRPVATCRFHAVTPTEIQPDLRQPPLSGSSVFASQHLNEPLCVAIRHSAFLTRFFELRTGAAFQNLFTRVPYVSAGGFLGSSLAAKCRWFPRKGRLCQCVTKQQSPQDAVHSQYTMDLVLHPSDSRANNSHSCS